MEIPELLHRSQAILNEALTYQPRKIVVMFSGGDDSLTAYHVLKELGYGPDYVIHGYTGTGVQQTTDFVKAEVARQRDPFLIADAGGTYQEYVTRKGFIGHGLKAHDFSFHLLKSQPFSRAIASIRQRRQNYPILLINGARRQESARRAKTAAKAIKRGETKNNIWVNLVNDWTEHDCKAYLADRRIRRNPVSVELCHSCECMCGTMQKTAERQQASFLFPEWGRWLDKLEAEVMKCYPWGWNENPPQRYHRERAGQMTLPGFQPLCTDCKRNLE